MSKLQFNTKGTTGGLPKLREWTRERKSGLSRILIRNSKFHKDLKQQRRNGSLDVMGKGRKPAVKEVGKENWKA